MLPQKGIHLKQRQWAMLYCQHWLVAYSAREKFLVALQTCAKLADMLLTKRTYTCLGGVSPLNRREPSCASAAFPRDAFPQQSTEYNRIETRDETSKNAQDKAILRQAVA